MGFIREIIENVIEYLTQYDWRIYMAIGLSLLAILLITVLVITKPKKETNVDAIVNKYAQLLEYMHIYYGDIDSIHSTHTPLLYGQYPINTTYEFSWALSEDKLHAVISIHIEIETVYRKMSNKPDSTKFAECVPITSLDDFEYIDKVRKDLMNFAIHWAINASGYNKLAIDKFLSKGAKLCLAKGIETIPDSVVSYVWPDEYMPKDEIGTTADIIDIVR